MDSANLGAAMAQSESRQAALDVRKMRPLLALLAQLAERHGDIKTCSVCDGLGHLPPATLVACDFCDGAGAVAT